MVETVRKFDIVERCRRIYIVKDGVESADYIQYSQEYGWQLFIPKFTDRDYSHPSAFFIDIAERMDTWYTTSQAAEALAEMGAFDEPPSTQRVAGWCRGGLLPGAVKVRGRGARGSGGSWRIPAAALIKLVERRKEQ